MQHLTPQQAQALWDAGGFIVLPDLPEGSEYGLDGTYHTIRKSFSGSKFVAPGLHLITISPSSSGSGGLGPGAIPLRSGLLVYLRPRERLVLPYDPSTESLADRRRDHDGDKEKVATVISDDHLRTLDPGLAAYPFDGLESWKALTSALTESIIRDVLGLGGNVDGMRGVEGDEDDLAAAGPADGTGEGAGGGKMRFVQFDLRRSWRDGAVGEELTRWARDKSVLLTKVVDSLGGDPSSLLARFQLAFVLLLHLSSPACLTVYKRILSLLARSADIHLHPEAHFPPERHTGVRALFIGLVQVIWAQLAALPGGVFDTELPELDVWYNEELEMLRRNIGSALGQEGGLWSSREEKEIRALRAGWKELRKTARSKFGWQLEELQRVAAAGSDEEEEEGEYAPVVVDI